MEAIQTRSLAARSSLSGAASRSSTTIERDGDVVGGDAGAFQVIHLGPKRLYPGFTIQEQGKCLGHSHICHNQEGPRSIDVRLGSIRTVKGETLLTAS
jgi:hypothetical protein